MASFISHWFSRARGGDETAHEVRIVAVCDTEQPSFLEVTCPCGTRSQSAKIFLDDIVSVIKSPATDTNNNDHQSDKEGGSDDAEHRPFSSLKLITYQTDDNDDKARRRKRVVYLCKFSSDVEQFLHAETLACRPPHISAEATAVSRRSLPPILIIVNPFSGQRRALQLWDAEVRPVFEDAGLQFELLKTEFPTHGTRIARELDLNAYQAVCIVSGDGLVAEFVRGLATRPDAGRALTFPILHVPGGTGNGLAASVAYQIRPHYQRLRLYDASFMRRASSPEGNPKIFHRPMFMSLTWGLVADIDLGSERFRWAGMARYHIEAFIRIARLPSLARYHARISFLPVRDDPALVAKLRAKTAEALGGDAHFNVQHEQHSSGVTKEEVETDWNANSWREEGCSTTLDDSIRRCHLVEAPPLSDDVLPDDWETIEGEFVYVLLTSTSHLGSDLPYLPCARLDEPHFYLSFVDWRHLPSRFHMAQLMLSMNAGGHLDAAHASTLRIIPVRACRVEVLAANGADEQSEGQLTTENGGAKNGGFLSLDGEPCPTDCTRFQVVSTSLCATVIGRRRAFREQQRK